MGRGCNFKLINYRTEFTATPVVHADDPRFLMNFWANNLIHCSCSLIIYIIVYNSFLLIKQDTSVNVVFKRISVITVPKFDQVIMTS